MSKRSDACVSEIGAGATGPDRRELLTRLLAVALADAMFWPCCGATTEALPLAHDRFLALSAKLCVMQIKDEALADAIQNALVGRFAAKELKHIASILESSSPHDADHLISRSGLGELAKSIVAAWYSGQVGAGEATRVLAYEDALAWTATGYAKAPGTCGVFGDWTAKPAYAFDSGHRR